jgi:hypothetical protein
MRRPDTTTSALDNAVIRIRRRRACFFTFPILIERLTRAEDIRQQFVPRLFILGFVQTMLLEIETAIVGT